jgi:DNA-binding transcriptional regulator YbjK
VVSRREVLLDAAITVLGEGGIHALTHRAVDLAAGLPAGSTSNHFRTRDALLNAVVERFAARERAAFDDVLTGMPPTTPAELAQVLTAAAKAATGAHRTLTLARYAILVEAAIHPALREQLGTTGARVDTWARNWLRVAGSTDPDRDAPIIQNHFVGIVLHELANPDPAFDPSHQFTALVTAVLRPHHTEVST